MKEKPGECDNHCKLGKSCRQVGKIRVETSLKTGGIRYERDKTIAQCRAGFDEEDARELRANPSGSTGFTC